MHKRSVAAIMSSTIWLGATVASRERTLWATALWTSRSRCMGSLPLRPGKNGGRLVRFTNQDVERRNSVVPFDQGRYRSEACNRLAVERPYGRIDGGAVIIDANADPFRQRSEDVAGEMDLADCRDRERGQILRRVPAVVRRAHEDVVDVAEDAAAGARHHGGEKLPFRNRRMAVAQIARRVLDEDAALQMILESAVIVADDVKRLLGERKRQQVAEIGTLTRAPGKMVRDESRRNALGHLANPLEVSGINAIGAAQREADAMEGDGIVPANPLELSERHPPAHVILGVNLEPGDVGAALHDLPMVQRAKADPRRGGDRTNSLVHACWRQRHVKASLTMPSDCRPGSCRSLRQAVARTTSFRALWLPDRRRNGPLRHSRSWLRH